MGYKQPLDEGELQSLNFRSIRDWIESNQGRIKAKPNKTVLYSGRDYDLEAPAMAEAEVDEFKGTPMYKRIEKMQKRLRDMQVPCDFQTLPDVLKTLKDYPKLVDKDRRELSFSHAFHFFDSLEKSKDLDRLVPNRKKVQRDCWMRLSEIFAGNAVGHIKIFDGAADDYSKLKEDKAFILKELPALLKNDRLSPKAKALLEKKISLFGGYFDRRYTELMAQLTAGRKALGK